MATAYKCDNCDEYFTKTVSHFKDLHINREKATWTRFNLYIEVADIKHDHDVCPKCLIMIFQKAIKILEKEV